MGGLIRYPPASLEEYVAAQREVNTFHSNGEMEVDDEDKLAAAVAELIEDRFPPIPKSILVVGCRTGYELLAFKWAFPEARVCGIDIVPEFVEIAKTRGEAYVMDMHKLTFTDGEFDWLFSAATLEHAHAPELVASEMVRVARHGIFVTADLEQDRGVNISHCSFSPDPLSWVRLFGEWQGAGSHKVVEGSVHILLWRP